MPNKDDNSTRVMTAFKTHHGALKRFLSRFLSNAQDIEDVAQEAFLRAYSAEEKTLIREPKSFLFRIARNVAVSELRSKSRQIVDYIEDQADSDVLLQEWGTEDEVQALERLGIHCEAVATLPPQCRKVYLLRKVYGLSHKQIATRMQISVSTTEKHLIRGVELCDRYVRDKTANEMPAQLNSRRGRESA